MGYADRQGRAYTSVRRPRAKGVCDNCGELVQYSQLKRQMEWYGNSLMWTGYLVCTVNGCYDTPQDQGRTILLPPDPLPIYNPRPEPYGIDSNQHGWGQYELYQPDQAATPTKAQVLAALAAASGVATPGAITDHSTTLTPADSPVVVFPVNAARQWIAVYNPANPFVQFLALGGVVTWGKPGNIGVGPGLASQASGTGNVPTGIVTMVSLIDQMPIWAWEG